MKKIQILFEFKDGAYGGGNQFLKALRREFCRTGRYISFFSRQNIFLANSYHCLAKAIFLKLFFGVKIIHRLDGIFSYYRGEKWQEMDWLIIQISQNLFDGIIFQSRWCVDQAKKFGFKEIIPYRVILNASDSDVFYPSKDEFKVFDKVKIVIVSWSSNQQKGFEYYQYLDNNLDFSRYEVSFVGSSPIRFSNIKMIPLLTTVELADFLRQQNMAVFAGQNEACSNALLEELVSGLPVVALDSGSNNELVQCGGEMFLTKEEMLQKIDLVAKNILTYKKKIYVPLIKNVADDYYYFAVEQKTRKRKIFLSLKYLIELFYLKFKLKYL